MKEPRENKLKVTPRKETKGNEVWLLELQLGVGVPVRLVVALSINLTTSATVPIDAGFCDKAEIMMLAISPTFSPSSYSWYSSPVSLEAYCSKTRFIPIS
jgi:hypothetical protein